MRQAGEESGYNQVEGDSSQAADGVAEDGKMKSTDIPNGYVVLGPSGNCILVDFDEDGKASNQASEVSINGWPETMIKNGRINPDLLILVHSVKGESGMLVKRLLATQLAMDGKPTTVAQVAKKGMLSKMAEKVYLRYMDEAMQRERLAQQIEKAKRV